jgi:hypothetical protein
VKLPRETGANLSAYASSAAGSRSASPWIFSHGVVIAKVTSWPSGEVAVASVTKPQTPA